MKETIQHGINEVKKLIVTEKQELSKLEDNHRYSNPISPKYVEALRLKSIVVEKIMYLQGKLDAYIECIKL